MNETAKCYNCQNVNPVKVANGIKKPENKGKKYFTCANCQEFNWVEDGVGKSSSGFSKVDYSKSPSKTVPTTPTTNPNWNEIKSTESKKMMVMSAMKAASEVTRTMIDSGMIPTGIEIDVDTEVINRMRKYIGAMEKESLTT